MAKGNQRAARRQRRSDRRLNNRAQTNVEMQDQGQVNLLQQQMQQAIQDYNRESQSAGIIGGGYQDTLADVQRPQFDRIGQEFQGALGSVAPMFGGDPYQAAGERAAGNGLGLAYGEAGSSMLANMDAREGMFRSSAGREGALWERNAQDQLLQQMEDAKQMYNDRLGQVRADDPWQIKQERSTLLDEQMQQRLLQSQMQSDKATSQFLQDFLAGQVGGGGGGGFGGGGGGGGGAPNLGPGGSSGAHTGPGGTVSHASIDNQNMREPIPNWVQRANQMRQADEFTDLPAWLQRAYDLQGPERWNYVQGLGGHKAQIFRKVRPQASNLFYQHEEENPYVAPGAGFFGGN
jgi:hypothetical protein